jgi:hypothetical protein
METLLFVASGVLAAIIGAVIGVLAVSLCVVAGALGDDNEG